MRGFLVGLREKNEAPPFDRLRANGAYAEIVGNFPIEPSLLKHEQY